ncbi:MAG TPA: DUF3267 domain-containing protein [Propionibacteriaceae bacterium]|nr:DUF3267 domain-containing protein [Propionibacteriaceae bacterium]
MVQLWQRSRAVEVLLGLSGLLAFPVAGVLLGGLYLSTHPRPGPVGFAGGVGILLVVAVLLLLCALTAVVHEGVHAVALRAVGRTPGLQAGTSPYLRLCVDRTEAPYGRGRFVLVMLSPVVLLTVVMVVGVAVGPYAGWLIIPTAFHLTASKMDVVYAIVALRQPAGTTCRIGEEGLELTAPADLEVP